MRFFLTILLLSLLCLTKLNAQQPYFNQRYNTDTYEIAWNVLETDSGYLIVGMNAFDLNALWNIKLIFIDSTGNIILSKTYGKNLTRFYSGGPGSLIGTNDGGYALAGSYEDTVETNGDAILWKFNSDGDTLWTKRYGDTSQQIGEQCKQTPDGGYIIFGVTTTFDTEGDYWLIKTDSAGNIKWDTIYGGQYAEFGVSIDVCDDGGYILAGITRSYGVNSGPFANNAYNKYIIKVDSTGTEQWNVVLGNEFDECIWNIQQTMDRGYIIGGCVQSDALIDFGIPNLIKLDSAGNIEWNKTYGPVRFNTTLFMVRELADGSFISAGQVTDSMGGHDMGLVLKVAANGDSLWYRTHEILAGSNSKNQYRDIRPTSDGGFIVAGWVNPDPPDTGGQDMWVVKMDSCGCLFYGCDTACSGDTTGVDEFRISDFKFQIYPNPTQGKFTIQIFNEAGSSAALTIQGAKQFEINVYDILGRNIACIKTGAKQIESDSYRMDISKHPAGVYLIQVWNENNYYSARVVKY